MRIGRFFIGLLALTAVACAKEEPFRPDVEKQPAGKDVVFRAVIDDGNVSKSYVDAGLNVLWNKRDRIAIFNNITRSFEYEFQGEDGESGGTFRMTEEAEAEYDGTLSGEAELGGRILAVYPYSQDTGMDANGGITYLFPDVQTYKEGSFGPGANVMVAEASTSNKLLGFKNAMGYLTFRLWGEDVRVSSVILQANGGEALAGKGTILMTEGVPVVDMDGSNSTDKIRLYCGDVLLGSSPTECTEFWFALPPVAFTEAKGGFTITVTTTDGGVFTRNAPMALTISRKTVERMAPLEVKPQYSAQGIELNGVSSTRAGVVYDAERTQDTFLLTMPTVTDFSNLVIHYDILTGDRLMVGGKEIANGVTPVDVSSPLSLVVCRGNYEKTFTLQARNTGLPVVRITTDGFTLAELESYQNSLQSPDNQDHRVWLGAGTETSIRIERPDGTVDCEVKTEIKGRGNFTWKWEKKPYALRFDKKKSVLDMPSHKRWVLLANWRDRTLLRNDAAFWLSEKVGLPYTVRGQFVELEFNGEHRGNYYLCEQIKIDPYRVNITELDKGVGFEDLSGGYLMEIDSYWDELNKFKSAEFNLKYMFKEPDEERSKTDVITGKTYGDAYDWMTDYINEFEQVLMSESAVARGEYADYLDVDSAIEFMLLNELTGNRDFFQSANGDVFGPHSTYLYKDKGGKLFMGPGWDFDYETFIPANYYPGYSFWSPSGTFRWRGFDNTGYYYHYLCYNPAFVNRIKELWNSKKSGFSGLTGYIEDMAARISLSQQFDEKIWPYRGQENRNDNHDYTLSFQDAIERMIESFSDRLDWMDDQINNHLSTTNPRFRYR